jgi:hypothetical protein
VQGLGRSQMNGIQRAQAASQAVGAEEGRSFFQTSSAHN